VICSDLELRGLADERQQVFSELWERLGADQQSALKTDQNRWVREYATACGVPPSVPPQLPATPAVIECFKRAGLARVGYLRSYATRLPNGTSLSPANPDTTMLARDRIGPSFKCAPGQDLLAQVICSDSNLSLIDLLFVQTYQALRHQLDEPGQQSLRLEANDFHTSVLQDCRVPASGQVSSPTEGLLDCVKTKYLRQRGMWASRLTGPAAEEANRAIQGHVALQQKLQDLAYLPATAEIDGVYGPATRAAISMWQTAEARPVTGFLGNIDGEALAHQDISATRSGPAGGLVGSRTGLPEPRMSPNEATNTERARSGNQIPLTYTNGIYTVPVIINGVLPLHFTVDSGAADVSLPADVFLTLLRTGTIGTEDYIGSGKYRLADGSTVESDRFYIRELRVGPYVLTKIAASIENVSSTPLLGQSFLSKIGTWTIDNDRHVLVLSPTGSQRPSLAASQTPDVPRGLSFDQTHVTPSSIDISKLKFSDIRRPYDLLPEQYEFIVANAGSQRVAQITIGYRETAATGQCSADLSDYDGFKKFAVDLTPGDSVVLRTQFSPRAKAFCIIKAQ
jgi:peptidoglycan hydrolase-like protein with peptidoglycan-binding domain